MPITPDGLPAWTRTATHVNYGGHVNKRNYLTRGVIDALTDMGAEALVRMAADLEAVVRTMPFAIITYLCSDSSPAAPTVESAFLMTGVSSGSYLGSAAPLGFPAGARNGNSDVSFTFATSYADAYGISGSFAPTHADAGVHGSSAGEATVDISGSIVRVRAFNGGSALSGARVTLTVW